MFTIIKKQTFSFFEKETDSIENYLKYIIFLKIWLIPNSHCYNFPPTSFYILVSFVMHDKACGHIGLLGKINTKHVHACVSFFKQSEAICRWKSSIYMRLDNLLIESHIYLLSHFLSIVTTKYDILRKNKQTHDCELKVGFHFSKWINYLQR